MQFLSMELTFCYSPNAVAIASLELALEHELQVAKKQEPDLIDGSIQIPNLKEILGLTDQQIHSILKAKELLYQCRQTLHEKRNLDDYRTYLRHLETSKHLKSFEQRNPFFWNWMNVYYKHVQQSLNSDDFDDDMEEDEQGQPAKPLLQDQPVEH